MTKLHRFDRFLLITALDYYLRNKEPSPIEGGIPYQSEMAALLNSLRSVPYHHD